MIKNKKPEYVDLKELDNLVPPQWRDRINLLFNKDVPKQISNPDDLLIARASTQTESQLQQFFHREFNSFAWEIKASIKNARLHFVQNDNGGESGFQRKKAEGTKAGFSDVGLLIYNPQTYARDVVYCEFKRIGAPSDIRLKKNQLEWFLELNAMGFKSYITNNPVFFRKVILERISKDYFYKNNVSTNR